MSIVNYDRKGILSSKMLPCTLSIKILTNIRYHFHFRPERQQIYQLVQLAVAMAVDLELEKPSMDSESKRTLAGCYYLSSWYSELLPQTKYSLIFRIA